MHPAFAETSHRPWPLPRGPWIIEQQWHNLLFAHWRVAHEALRPLIPPVLEIDTYGNDAWLGVVPFEMQGVRFRWLPPIPTASRFSELNVRTYVRFADRPGVWFFSLDAASALAVIGGRNAFHLPYFRARMSCAESSGTINYASRRTHANAPSADFQASYRPTGSPFHAQPGSLEHFLAERYCLYATDRSGNLLRSEIQHPPWPLRSADAQIAKNTMASSLPLLLGKPDQLHFSQRQDVVVWPLRSLSHHL
jgi:uncharacterized protein YqjF (DUF2071 family)